MYRAKAAYFDENVIAPWASSEYGPDEIEKLDRLFQHAGPLRGFRILEPGCGTGRLTEILSDKTGEEGRVVALDISPMMIDAAIHRNRGRDNVEIHLCAVEDFPAGEKSYDMILCHQVFPHFEDKKKVINIFSAALRPGARLILFHFINLNEINDLHRKAGTAVKMDMMPGEREMRGLFDDAGLDIVFITDDRYGYFLSATKR
ncbi:MAG: class I SAM-dependent methyltransferase [Deltaproteobacteria bacterium]|nr:class I SAM-dependent methyltransferase [Deltaproteobacteria bacterium]